jgi:ADP-heptose:LPS heptosyltransferase
MSEAVAYVKTGIGNLIVITPAMQALASMDPSGKIDVCMAKEWKDHRAPALRNILEASPFIDRVVEYPGPMNGYKRYFIPLQCETSAAGKYFLERARIYKNRWPGADWHRSKVHEVEANMRLVRGMGYAGPTPPLYVPVAENPALDLPQPIIGLCNGAFTTATWDKKHWPYFNVLAAAVKGWFGGSIVGVGGPREMDGVPLDENFCGKLSFIESAKVISQCDLFISTDTGCMHAADALGVPLIALFGPTLTSKNGPVGKRSHVVRAGIKCAPCQYTDLFHTCSVYLCMNSIGIGDVMREARRILR